MDFYPNSDNTNYNSTPQGNRPSGFAIASLVCGIVAVIACCTGVLSIPTGALGILFAVLTKRKGQSMSGMCVAGIWLSCVGMALGILMTAYSFFMVFNNPVLYEEVNTMFQTMYGMNIEEYFSYIINQYTGGMK